MTLVNVKPPMTAGLPAAARATENEAHERESPEENRGSSGARAAARVPKPSAVHAAAKARVEVR